LTTGLVVGQDSIRDLNGVPAASPSNPSVTFGSAFDTTARVGDVPVDDIGDRRLEQGVDQSGVVAEQLLELGYQLVGATRG
jgi:hypothetical protein